MLSTATATRRAAWTSFEQLAAAVSARLISTQEDAFDRALQAVLGWIGEFFEVDWVTVREYREDGAHLGYRAMGPPPKGGQTELRDIEFTGPTTYRIVVQGTLSEEWSDRLAGLAITTTTRGDAAPHTTLAGRIRDQAELSGMLETLYELLLPILEVERVESATEGSKSCGEETARIGRRGVRVR